MCISNIVAKPDGHKNSNYGGVEALWKGHLLPVNCFGDTHVCPSTIEPSAPGLMFVTIY